MLFDYCMLDSYDLCVCYMGWVEVVLLRAVANKPWEHSSYGLRETRTMGSGAFQLRAKGDSYSGLGSIPVTG